MRLIKPIFAPGKFAAAAANQFRSVFFAAKTLLLDCTKLRTPIDWVIFTEYMFTYPQAWSRAVSDAPVVPARQSPRSQSLDLEFVEPSTLRFGNREHRVGGVVYRFLQTLFGVTNREQSLAELAKVVWGHPVNRNTLWSACRRARCVLIELKHPLRVSIRGDRIALV